MNRVNTSFLGQRDNSRDIEVCLNRPLSRADLIGFISLESMKREPVLVRIDSYSAQAKLVRGAENPDRDFAAIGSQQFPNGFVLLHS